jgi:hypothetical protein
MIDLRTTALIAVVSLVGAATPAAFAQDGNTLTADQSNGFSATISQTQSDDDQEQGFCLQSNQQNAAAGNDATNTGVNAIVANDESEVDC